jgi:hypothetical protein
MITKIELGSFNRGKDNPILLKEKIESDGSLSVRIYQRKDIDSIASFKDKIKTMMKYGIEDFCMKHETFRPLLANVGAKRIEYLNDNDPENALDLLQSIRSQAKIGIIAEKKETEFKKILENHGVPGNYRIDLNSEKYKNDDFFSDLKKFASSSDPSPRKINLKWLSDFKENFKSKNILTRQQIEENTDQINLIKENLKNYRSKQSQRLTDRPGNDISSSENNLPERITHYPKNFPVEIEQKLDEMAKEIKQRSTNPTDEDIKNYLLLSIETIPGYGNRTTPDNIKEASKMRTTINISFSTSWWVSEEKKLKAQEKVRQFFEIKNNQMPEAVRNRIYTSPTSNPQRGTFE